MAPVKKSAALQLKADTTRGCHFCAQYYSARSSAWRSFILKPYGLLESIGALPGLCEIES